jgi:hypothetical protein
MSRSCVSYHRVVDRRRTSFQPSLMPIPPIQRCTRRAASVIALSSLVAALAPVRSFAQRPAPHPSNPALAELQAALDSVMHKQPIDFTAYSKLTETSRRKVLELIALDALRTPDDFLVTSTLATDPSGFYESRRLEHELALVALVMGQPEALKRLGLTWDGLNWSMGRGQRIGTYMRNGVANNMDPVPAPAVIRELFKNPSAARARAAEATNNAELQKMRDEDQKDREDPIDQAKMARMDADDSVHKTRTLELLEEGAAKTGRDMHNAATVLQHGDTPDDYRLAHELSIAAIALGDTTALWLVSRSYDRMLLSMGHRQRLNTQYGGAEAKPLPLDTTGVNDRIRVALGSRRLADAGKAPGTR